MNRFIHEGTGWHLIGAPEFVRIADVPEGEIRAGSPRTDAALASEHALMQRFAVSRNTVRKSLEILNEKGLITTRNSIGSFITHGRQTIDDRRGWSVALSSDEDALGTRVLRIDRALMDFTDAPAEVSGDCLYVDRLRFQVATGRAVSLKRSRVPWR